MPVAVPAPALNVGFNTPFQSQIDFLRQKLNLPTQRWDDIARAAHDRAVIVADSPDGYSCLCCLQNTGTLMQRALLF